MKAKPVHALRWVAEPFEPSPTFVLKKMFGCEALCLHDRMMLVLAAKDEPWNGLLVCTSREHHESLIKDFPALSSHPILGKWLYVSQGHERFEEIVSRITPRVLGDDPRIGVDFKAPGVKIDKK